MSNARDKANIPALNFSSTGIDDNATSTAITIDSSQNVDVVGTTTSSNFISDGTGYGIKFPLNGTATLNTNSNSVIFTGSGSSGDYLAGTLNLQSRGNLDRDINLITGATPSNTLTAHGNGDVSFYEDTGTTAKFFWDASAESLSIGSSTASNILRLDNSTPTVFDLSATNTGQDALFIRSSDETSAVNAKGNSIGFGAPDGHSNRHASISAVQTSSDRDFVGLAFHTHNSGSQSDPMIETMRLTSDGKLGIGITSPTQKLDVNGTVKATAFQGDGSALTGISGGKVLQVVQGTATSSSTTSTSFTSTGLSASITPSSISSKILIIVTLVQCAVNTANKNATSTIFRGATNLAPTGTGLHKSFATIYASSGGALANNQTYSYLDSPSTTSATTYTVYFATESGATMTMGINSTTSYIQLLEIGA